MCYPWEVQTLKNASTTLYFFLSAGKLDTENFQKCLAFWLWDVSWLFQDDKPLS